MKTSKLIFLMLIPVLIISILQAEGVYGRIQESILFHEKFEEGLAITASYETLVLFIVGSLVGIGLSIAGFIKSKRTENKILMIIYAMAFVSLAVFGCVWIGMVISPLVELRWYN